MTGKPEELSEMSGFNAIDEILADIRLGKMAVLMDDEDR
jgi:hypothetical protein